MTNKNDAWIYFKPVAYFNPEICLGLFRWKINRDLTKKSFFSDCRFCNNEFQMRSVLPLVEAHGCVLMAQEGKFSYSQSTELKWGDKRITQSMKYQVITTANGKFDS